VSLRRRSPREALPRGPRAWMYLPTGSAGLWMWPHARGRAAVAPRCRPDARRDRRQPPIRVRAPARRAQAAMTPPAAQGATIRRPIAPHVPRRISGPARPVRGRDHGPPPRANTPSRIRRRRWLIALPRLAGQFAVALPESRALDRLIRGRAWIALIATALVGI